MLKETFRVYRHGSRAMNENGSTKLKHRFGRLARLVAAALFALLIPAAYRSVTFAAETLRLGYSGSTPTQLAGSLAIEHKLFDLYGVHVELTQSAGTTMIRALDAKSLDVAIVGGGQALSGYLKGLEMRIIAGLVNTVPYQLWAKPEIAQIKDLKGKMIANTPPGTSLNLGMAIMLQRMGFDPQRDVRLIAFGRIGLISQSLFTGVVDAALLAAPENVEAKKLGMRMLMDLTTTRVVCPFSSVVTTRAVVEKSPVALERFLRAIVHGIKLAVTNPDMAKKTISKNLRLTDPEAIDEVYQRVAAAYERMPIMPKEAIETVIKLSPTPPARNPFGVLEMSMLERIDKEGFVRTLYSK